MFMVSSGGTRQVLVGTVLEVLDSEDFSNCGFSAKKQRIVALTAETVNTLFQGHVSDNFCF